MIFRTPTPTRTPTPINVGNFVWHDLNADGRQDAGEPGLAGITVQLWNSAKTQLIDTAVTNASGNYALTAPTPGDYRVRVVLPSAGDQFSPKDNAAAGDHVDSDINPSGASLGFTDIFTFASNVISITIIDAGLKTVSPTRTPTATRTSTRHSHTQPNRRDPHVNAYTHCDRASRSHALAARPQCRAAPTPCICRWCCGSSNVLGNRWFLRFDNRTGCR